MAVQASHGFPTSLPQAPGCQTIDVGAWPWFLTYFPMLFFFFLVCLFVLLLLLLSFLRQGLISVCVSLTGP